MLAVNPASLTRAAASRSLARGLTAARASGVAHPWASTGQSAPSGRTSASKPMKPRAVMNLNRYRIDPLTITSPYEPVLKRNNLCFARFVYAGRLFPCKPNGARRETFGVSDRPVLNCAGVEDHHCGPRRRDRQRRRASRRPPRRRTIGERRPALRGAAGANASVVRFPVLRSTRATQSKQAPGLPRDRPANQPCR